MFVCMQNIYFEQPYLYYCVIGQVHLCQLALHHAWVSSVADATHPPSTCLRKARDLSFVISPLELTLKRVDVFLDATVFYVNRFYTTSNFGH